jgi:hypothetical protein
MATSMYAIIRKLTERDMTKWADLRKNLWPNMGDGELKNLAHLPHSNDFICYFAEVKKKVLGFIEISLQPCDRDCF